MTMAIKTKYEETIDEIMDGIAKHLSSLPEDGKEENQGRCILFFRISATAVQNFDSKKRHWSLPGFTPSLEVRISI